MANTASATSSTPDPDAGNNVATATVRAQFARTRLERPQARPTAGPCASAGIVNYRIVVRNTGGAGARRPARLRPAGEPGWRSSRHRRGAYAQRSGVLDDQPPGARQVARVPRDGPHAGTTAARRVSNTARVNGANLGARTARARVLVRPVQAPADAVTG